MNVIVEHRPTSEICLMSEMATHELAIIMSAPQGHWRRQGHLAIATGHFFYVPSRNELIPLKDGERYEVRVLEPNEIAELSN